MQWFKSAMVVSSVLMVSAAFSVEGCSSGTKPTDGGGDVLIKDGAKTDAPKPRRRRRQLHVGSLV